MTERDKASEALVAAAKGADRGAVEQLLVRNLPGLEAFVRLRMGPMLRGLMTAPDLVLSVCREALADLGGFEYRGEGPFRHLLFARAECGLSHAEIAEHMQKSEGAARSLGHRGISRLTLLLDSGCAN